MSWRSQEWTKYLDSKTSLFFSFDTYYLFDYTLNLNGKPSTDSILTPITENSTPPPPPRLTYIIFFACFNNAFCLDTNEICYTILCSLPLPPPPHALHTPPAIHSFLAPALPPSHPLAPPLSSPTPPAPSHIAPPPAAATTNTTITITVVAAAAVANYY